MRFINIRGKWLRVVRNQVKTGASYLWFDPPKNLPQPVAHNDLTIYASMFAGTP